MSQRAIDYNKRRGYSRSTIKKIQGAVGAEPDGHWGPLTAAAVMQWQSAHGLEADGAVGPATLAALAQAEGWAEVRALTPVEASFLIGLTVIFEGGSSNPYGATNRDGEYEGRFDEPKRDAEGRPIPPAERRDHAGFKPHSCSKFRPGSEGIHVGLSWGAWQFTQDGGSLGRVLERWREIDEGEFFGAFGGSERALAVLEVVMRPGSKSVASADGTGRRSPRVQPVLGEDLWRGLWLQQFRDAGKLPGAQQAQREIAAERYLQPVIKGRGGYKGLRDFGLTGQADVAVAFDIAIQFGVGGCLKRLNRPGVGDSGDIRRLIDQLPERRRPRRRHIMSQCLPWVSYAL